jgi:hypothetical protein
MAKIGTMSKMPLPKELLMCIIWLQMYLYLPKELLMCIIWLQMYLYFSVFEIKK